MSDTLPACPQCGLENTYPDGDNYVCPDCGFEWPTVASADEDDTAEGGDGVVRDANGNPLMDGDAVILIKDLKVKGSSIVLKKGTKVKSIRLPAGPLPAPCWSRAGSTRRRLITSWVHWWITTTCRAPVSPTGHWPMPRWPRRCWIASCTTCGPVMALPGRTMLS